MKKILKNGNIGRSNVLFSYVSWNAKRVIPDLHNWVNNLMILFSHFCDIKRDLY